VVTLLAQGMSNAEIAAAMFVSEATVKSHLGRITAKWGVRDRIQVLIRATQYGLVSWADARQAIAAPTAATTASSG
jgi:DNA-binding NarL/FixJ family response regulator